MSEEKRGFVNVAEQFFEQHSREGLVRSDLAAEFRFEDERSVVMLDDAFEMMRFLSDNGQALFLRKSVEIELTQAAGQVLQNCSLVKKFAVNDRKGVAATERDSLKNELQDAIANLASILACHEADHHLTRELQVTSQNARKNSAEIEEALEKSRTLLQEVRDEVGKSTVRREAQDFSKAASKHNIASWIWLAVICCLLAALAAFIWFVNEPADAAFSYIFLIKKVGIAACIATLLTVGVKSYSSHKHLEAVALHRSRALTTYGRLLEAAGEDKDSRAAVLQRAAESVFELGLSGYEQNRAPALPNGLATQILKMTSKK